MQSGAEQSRLFGMRKNKVSRFKVDIKSDMFAILFSFNEKRNGLQSAPINRDEKKTGRKETAETSLCHNI